eukprot:363295-Chlamydomonas_euryale.AAC.2
MEEVNVRLAQRLVLDIRRIDEAEGEKERREAAAELQAGRPRPPPLGHLLDVLVQRLRGHTATCHVGSAPRWRGGACGSAGNAAGGPAAPRCGGQVAAALAAGRVAGSRLDSSHLAVGRNVGCRLCAGRQAWEGREARAGPKQQAAVSPPRRCRRRRRRRGPRAP